MHPAGALNHAEAPVSGLGPGVKVGIIGGCAPGAGGPTGFGAAIGGGPPGDVGQSFAWSVNAAPHPSHGRAVIVSPCAITLG